MKKLMDTCNVVYETKPETNGWYTFENRDFEMLFKNTVMPVSDVLRLARIITEKAGEFDEQLEDFSKLCFEDGCPIEIDNVAVDTYENYVVFAMGPVEYDFDFEILKSKLDSLEVKIFLGEVNGWLVVHEVPGVLAFKFLQAYAKYVLGELEDMEWKDPDFEF